MGVNQAGYEGERIEIAPVLARTLAAARQSGWQIDRSPAGVDRELAFVRREVAGAARLYVSAGIHGDEPAGPLAVERLLTEAVFPADLDVTLCPCLNPTGFPASRRENAEGVDLNRDYLQPTTGEIRAHLAWLEQQAAFDLTLCLHEDWEASGFYLYELNPDGRPSLAGRLVEAVQAVCPIDHAPMIDGRRARGGIIRPGLDPATRAQWPEAFWLLQYKTRLSYTLEAPSDFPLPVRVAALVTAVKAALDAAQTPAG